MDKTVHELQREILKVTLDEMIDSMFLEYSELSGNDFADVLRELSEKFEVYGELNLHWLPENS